MAGQGFRDLVVWQRAFDACLAIYRVTSTYPGDERFGLVSETRKTARPVVYNIAEGRSRQSRKEYVRYLWIANGSAAELETQLLPGHRLDYLAEDALDSLVEKNAEVRRMLAALIRKLGANPKT